MCIGQYTPNVGEVFLFTPDPNNLNGLDYSCLEHAGKLVIVKDVEKRIPTNFPFCVRFQEKPLSAFVGDLTLSASELSFITVTTTLKDWL